ncbi:MAG: MurT ligase domain-containing protein, partial [Gordonia sp. (in: high G+C Gram-positive bacteria)]
DVRFEAFETMKVIAAGERSADLGVRLLYAGAEHTTVADPMKAIASCPPGRVEVLANYTAFRDLGTALERAGAIAAPTTPPEPGEGNGEAR